MNPYLTLPILALIAAGLLAVATVAMATRSTPLRRPVASTQMEQPAPTEAPDIAGTVIGRLNPSNRRWAGR